MVKNNLKYMIIFLIITLLMCIDVINVSAGTTCTVSANSGSGNKSKIGSTTKKCAGAICARTVVFKSGKFTESNGTSAIYGIRVSIQEKGSSGYTTKKKINVWATKEMKKWVVNKLNERSEIKNALGTHVFVSGTKLSSYGSSTKDPGIKRLDDSSATYNGYVKYLSNHPKILNKILKNFGGDYASVQDIIDSDEKIRIKIEPVYVLFVLGKSVDYPGFIIGTAQGIANIADHATNGSEKNAVVVAQSKSNNGSISQNYYGGKVREIYSSMGSSYNVITNFLKSVFVNPKSIPKTYGGWHEKAGNGNAGVGYIYMKESCKTTGKITISNYQTRNNSNPKTGSTTFKGCATFELQKKKKDSDSYVNKGTFNIGTACNGSNDHKKQKTFKGLDKGTYRVILKKITKNPPEGKVTNTYYYYKTVKYNSNITGSLVIKQGQTSHTIAFYNYIPKVTTTTTSAKKYHILVSKNQLNGNFGTIAANAAVPASGNNFKYVYNDAAYSSVHPQNRNGCKTSSSDTTAGRIQCYALYINGTDYSNNLASVPTLQKYDGSVTFALEKKYGSSWREVRKKKIDADQMNDKIDPIIEWTVSSAGWYRVVEKGCSNCGTSKTYSKTQAFKDKSGNSVYTFFRQGKTSKGFYIADNTGKSASSSSGSPGTGNYFRVWFLNYSPRCVNCCPEMLAETKTENDTNKIKYKLISLYNYQLSENNRDFNKLLNFTPEDTASTIQSKIENETIWCETTNLAEKVTTNACNEADFGLSDNTSDKKLPMYKTTTENYLINDTTKYTNSNSISLSSYVSNTSNAKLVSNALFGFSSSDNVYCYVNYAFDYKTNGIIKPNTSVYSESLIWKTQPTNKVGDMFAFVHCEGIPEDSDSLNDNRGNLSDTILEIFKDGKLKIVDSSSTLLQTLSFKSMGEESFIYKPVETSDVECSALGEHFSLNSDGVCVYSDSTETEGDDATDVDTCGLNEVRINGICVDNSYENDLEDDNSDIGQENDDESGDSSDNSIIFYDESYASSYLSYDTILKYSIVYDEDLYSNVSTGTVNNKSEGQSIGWGVPIPIDSDSGDVKIVYEFDTSSDLYQSLNIGSNIESTCSYDREECNNCSKLDDIKIRFVNSKNPFSGANGNGREMGSNWNSCLVGKNTINKFSNVSASDIASYAQESSDPYVQLAKGSRYCKYGDVNCNNIINAEDITLYTNRMQTLNTANVYLKKIADVNKDGIVDNNDKTMVQKFIDKDTLWWTSKEETGCMNEIAKTLSSNYLVNNSRNSSSQQTPMYSFTLTPKDIQQIRNYNIAKTTNASGQTVSANSYISDDNLACDGDYQNCISTFITDLIDNSSNLKIGSYGGYCLDNVTGESGHVQYITTQDDITLYRKICLR